jgi:hypothetical protein
MIEEFNIGDTIYFSDTKCSYNAMPPYDIIRKGIITSYDNGIERYEVCVNRRMFFYLKPERMKKNRQEIKGMKGEKG